MFASTSTGRLSMPDMAAIATVLLAAWWLVQCLAGSHARAESADPLALATLPAANGEEQAQEQAADPTGGQEAMPMLADAAAEGLTLVFRDEFDESTLNRQKWATCYWWNCCGCTNKGNNELQWYRPGNIRVGNGILRLEAKREDVQASDRKTYRYSSGMITSGRSTSSVSKSSRFAFHYGYAEVRARVPSGRGLWPAIWLLPDDHHHLPEIDVMEIIGQRPGVLEMHFHYEDRDRRHHRVGRAWHGPDFSRGWHRFGIEWRPDALIWYVDGVERWRFDDQRYIPKEPMYLLINLAVGGDWPGPPDPSTRFPSSFLIDYVRIWQRRRLRPGSAGGGPGHRRRRQPHAVGR
jgi:beta-glucanase (GH16 family)